MYSGLVIVVLVLVGVYVVTGALRYLRQHTQPPRRRPRSEPPLDQDRGCPP